MNDDWPDSRPGAWSRFDTSRSFSEFRNRPVFFASRRLVPGFRFSVFRRRRGSFSIRLTFNDELMSTMTETIQCALPEKRFIENSHMNFQPVISPTP